MATKESMPEYGLEKLEGDLPENAPQGRTNMYIGLLTPLTQAEPGDWYRVAAFKTPTGARNAEKAIANRERPIPAGEWEFQSRKVANPDGVGQKHSVLYARFLGNGSGESQNGNTGNATDE